MLVKFSKQQSDTVEEIQDKRIRKGLVTEFFVRKGEELVESWRELADHVSRPVSRPSLLLADICQLRHKLGGEYLCDLIVTSPPYAGTYNYAHHHRRRRAFLGLSAKHLLRGEIGARRDFAEANSPEQLRGMVSQWEEQVLAILREMSGFLRPDGVAVVLIGDGEIAGEFGEIDQQIERLSAQADLKFLACASQARPYPRDDVRRHARLECESPSRTSDKKAVQVRREHLIALQKPVVKIRS